MPAERQHQRKLEAELSAMLAPKFPGITVTVSPNDRWDRMCVTFCWAGFATLLPEERFHRLVTAIPEHFRQSRLSRFVWLELAPGETVDAFLRLPRSEEAAMKETKVYGELVQNRFFESLAESLSSSPEQRCPGDFTKTVAVLSAKKYTPTQIQDARLVFIRHGAYCDCQVLQTLRSELSELHAAAG